MIRAARIAAAVALTVLLALGLLTSGQSGAGAAPVNDPTIAEPADVDPAAVDPAAAPGGPGVDPIDPIEEPQITETETADDGTLIINTPEGTSNAVMLIVVVTLVSLVPGLLMLTTTFPRFLIVLGLTRQGLGLNTTPPNQVLAGLAAFLTLFVMGPVFSEINEAAVQPAIRGELTQGEALDAGWGPLRDFMLDHTREADLAMLYDLTDSERPPSAEDVTPRFLIPAFVLSELRAAFLIGFLIWVPFLLIDLIVSTVLAALGMLMMPPVVVSLPVKLALFVLVDGWALLAGSLLKSVA
jgi:flagellar biosynthetic protein FliP